MQMSRNAGNLRNLDSMLSMAPQLFAGLTDNPAIGLIAAPLLSHAQSFLGGLLDDFTGAPISRVPSQRMNDTAMLYRMRLDYLGNKGSLTKELNNTLVNSFAESIYKGLYPDDKVRAEQMNKGNYEALKILLGMANVTGEGVSTISASIARRANILAPGNTEANMKQTRDRISYLTKELVGGERGIFNAAYATGETGSLTFTEVGQIASKLIAGGGLSGVNLNDDNYKDAVKRVSDNFTKKLIGYSKAIETLKDVFDGDLKNTLSKMESLSGGSIYNMSLGHLQSVAKGMEHMSLVTGIDGAAFSTLTRTFYTQGVAQGGGNEAFARNSAMLYSYNLVNGPRVYGVSQIQYERAFATMAGQTAASGKDASIAAAYYAFLGTQEAGNRVDNEANREAFKKAIGDNYSYDNLRSKHDEWMAKEGRTATFEQTRSSSQINELKDNPFVTNLASDATYGNLRRNIRSSLNKEILDILGNRSTEELQNLGINLSANSRDLVEQIRNSKLANANVLADRVAERQRYYYGELGRYMNTTAETAEAVAISDEDAEKLRNTILPKLGKLKINLPGGGGIESILALGLRRARAGKSLEIGEGVAAWLKGVDTASLSDTELAKAIKEAEKVSAQVKKAVDEQNKEGGKDGRGKGKSPQKSDEKSADGTSPKKDGTTTAQVNPATSDLKNINVTLTSINNRLWAIHASMSKNG